MKNKILKIILLIILAEIGNLVLDITNSLLLSPLFLDTVFTVALTFYAGLVPGLIAALLSNPLFVVVMKFVFHQPETYLNILFVVPGMLIVFTTWLFSRKKDNFSYSRSVTFLYLLAISLASAFASCFSAAFMETFIRPLFDHYSTSNTFTFSRTDTFSNIFGRLGLGSYLAALLPRIPVTVVDRIICTFAGFGVYKLYLCIENKRRGGRRR